MAEYLAPGVYIEETSFRSKSIEGVSTSTTAFVGPTRRGPASGTPELLTSVADFERIYGGSADLDFGSGKDGRNYLALAVQAYFENGGSRLYVSRAFKSAAMGDNGCSGASLDSGKITIAGRFPGAAGNGSVRITEQRSPVSGSAIANLPVGTVLATGVSTVVVLSATGWKDSADAAATAPTTGEVCTFTLTAVDADGNVQSFEGLGYHTAHPRFVGNVLPASPSRRLEQLQNQVSVTVDSTESWSALRTALLATSGVHALTNGDDGAQPDSTAYTAALAAFERVEDISIVAAPGHTEQDGAAAIRQAILTHVHKRGLYRIAVLDSAKGDTVSEVRDTRGGIDSDRAALYYPWVTIANPLARAGDARQPREINVPPSGFLCGIFARNDAENGVFKSPANEIVRGAIRFESDISFAENEVLNPLGVNCLRYFSGRGYRVWGARTTTSDPEWKYVSVRRYFNFLEASIERGTQWAVFEPNGEALWTNIRDTISSFLYNEWRSGALLGASPKEAFFVRCDRTTMTQNDLDNGRLVCLVGVAVVKPAEFVIFRIGQMTADARQ